MNSYLELIRENNCFDFNNNKIDIKNVIVDKDNNIFYIDLKILNTLTYKDFKAFYEANTSIFNKLNYSFKLNIIYDNFILNSNDVSEYYNMVLDRLIHKGNYLIQGIKNFNINVTNNLINISVDQITNDYLKYKDLIIKEFKVYFLDILLDFSVNESLSLEINEQKNEIIDEYNDKLKKAKEIAYENERKTNLVVKNDYKSKRVHNQILIKDIPSTYEELCEYQNLYGDAFFTIEGEIFFIDVSLRKTSYLLTIKLTDYTDSLLLKKWVRSDKERENLKEFKEGTIIRANGKIIYDAYVKGIVMDLTSISYVGEAKKKQREDNAPVKRVELHAHTKMSSLDGISEPKSYINTALAWGHKAIAFTDRNGVYAIPDIDHAAHGKDIKPIFGVDIDYLDDLNFHITYKDEDYNLKDATYVVFDIETTGFSQEYDEIIEIGAHKIKNGVITEVYETFVNPNRPIPNVITELTSITDDMVKDAPNIKVALKEFLDFSSDAILVAHNADFDIGMMMAKCRKYGFGEIEFCGIDTLNLARALYGHELTRFNLKALCKYFKVKQEHHHRATDDTKVLGECFIYMLNDLKEKGINNYNEINTLINEEHYFHVIPKRINLLAKNKVGYKNMFKIVSDALTTHLSSDARALRSVIDKYKEGILILSSGSFGEVFENALNRSQAELENSISYCDIIEVQPLSSYNHLIHSLNDGHDGKAIIKDTIIKIINTAKKLNKIVVATSDCFYIEKEEKKYRDILITAKKIGGGRHELFNKECPDAYLRTTEEMLNEFSFLDSDLAYEIVVTNTNLVNDMIENVECFYKEMFVPADDEFKDHEDPNFRFESMIDSMNKIVKDNVLKNYGENPHGFVKARVERELKSIISSGYYSTYFMSHLMVKDSLENGYLVGSRGSVGSSLVATMMDITEVNPLPPHYVCPHCKFMAIKFSEEDKEKIESKEEEELQEILRGVGSGYDLPDLKCPRCNHLMNKDGHDIPFETFLGFNGDKVPDIDLNFSGEYQSKAHMFVRKLMGYDNSFRGGTVSTIADKQGFGYVNEFAETKKINIRNVEIDRISKHITGVKRSTGQHPGGIVVVPKRIDIFDVTPIQYPANDKESAWRTTHFDYHAFENNLLKLDILGHDDPTLIKYFMDIVHTHQNEFPFDDARKIPVDDKKVLSLFGSTEGIGVKPDDILSEVASFAVPEFGTNFVRQMLIDTKPTTFAGLVKISGLSHGTDVWLNNAKELVDPSGKTDFGVIPFDKIIGCRDDIMVDLLFNGVEPLKAFKIMEFVRKGNVAKDPESWNKYKVDLIEKNVPEWYIWSCEQIKYMFPKAHATAYVLMAIRIAWFKVYKPAMFYSAYFSKRAKAHDVESYLGGSEKIKERIKELSAIPKKTVKDEDLITTLYVALEATARGIKFLPIDIKKSDSFVFLIEDDDLINGSLRIPFVAVDGLGDNGAQDIKEKRDEKEFTSKRDVANRTKLNQTIFEKFEKMKAFGDLPEEDAIVEEGIFAFCD